MPELRLPVRRGPRRRLVVWLLVGLGVLIVFISPLVGLLAEWPWFTALGYGRVFATRLVASFTLGVLAGGVAFAFLYANLRFAQRGVVPNPVVVQGNAQRPAVDVTRLVRRLALPAALAFALFLALAVSTDWMPVLQFLHQTPFGVTDPIFGRDLAYYVFTLPIVTGVLAILTTLVTVSLLACGALYALRGDVVVYRRTVTIEPSARLHLGLLIVAMFVLTALRIYFVRLPGTLYSTTGPLFGASFADLHGRLTGLRIAGVAAILGAILVLAGLRTKRPGRIALLAVVSYFAVSLLGVSVYPAIVQKFVVAPNELSKETPQLRRHIDATRRAWGLDRVLVRDLSGEARLTERDIQANRPTIDNVRLWDRDPLRLTFTHGMGLTLGPVNEVTEEGLPVLFIKDLPPASTVSLAVKRPEIYFGELSDAWVFANTGQPEFDYPSGDENIFTSYKGSGGVRVGGLLRRLVLSAYFRSLKVLLSSDITSESRAMYIRNIRQRARMALPFLSFDADPYMVIDDAGRLRWILDAYTATSSYPYAQPLTNGVNYMRNSVKVVIDAYDGSVTAYQVDSADPLVRTFAKIFPGIFQPLGSMPADLRAHLRYPEDLFHLQSELYGTYHMAEPGIFYHREDQWQKPVLSMAPERADPFLRHMVMRLPGERQAEFILMVPFTPRGKDNLASWMVARNDGEHYGELVVYRFPKQSLVFGPTQIVNRINQDTEIARQIALWDQRGSQVIRGNLLVIPIEESLIYVMPLYLRAQGGRIPELKRVVVAYQNRVVMEETLDAGLAQLFGGSGAVTREPARVSETPGAATALSARAADLARRANESLRRAVEAQRAGDWARYGEELRRLEDVLRQLQAAVGERKP